MGIEIVLKIAGIGMLVAVSCQLLKQTGRDDIAMLAALMGLEKGDPTGKILYNQTDL